jgi:hypothetical protein
VALGGREMLFEGIGRREPQVPFRPSAAHKGRDGRKSRGAGTAHKVQVAMLLEIREQGITGEASVKETDTVGR